MAQNSFGTLLKNLSVKRKHSGYISKYGPLIWLPDAEKCVNESTGGNWNNLVDKTVVLPRDLVAAKEKQVSILKNLFLYGQTCRVKKCQKMSRGGSEIQWQLEDILNTEKIFLCHIEQDLHIFQTLVRYKQFSEI